MSVEIWGRAPGIFPTDIQKNFLTNNCTIGLHHVKGMNFRLSINLLESESMNALYIDLRLDPSSYEKFFEVIDEADYRF